MIYCQIVFSRPLDNSYTYLFDGTEEEVQGRRIIASLGRQKLTGFVIACSSDPPPDLNPNITLKHIERIVDPDPVFDTELIQMAEWMAKSYICSTGEALSAMIPGGKRDRDLSPVLPGEDEGLRKENIRLSDEQEYAVERILSSGEGQYYLYGITGSGKTEVFLRAAEATLKEGRGIIYLVPEISLTHQVVQTIRSRFGEQSAVLHSSLTQSQRIAQWRRILKGEARLVIGARSAIFAPLENIGLIILDEEHESSYKSGTTPRYHARQLALYRSGVHAARVVMGSATPSVEAWHHMNRGTLTRLNLTRRLSGGAVPEIRVVNIKGGTSSLGTELREGIRATLKEGRQVILFLNRRGFGYFYHCRSCGADFSCTRCSVSLTYHKSKQKLVCHHCGFQRPVPQVCPECGSLELGYSGFGTEKVAQDVEELVPSARILRLDTDSTRKKGVLEQGINDFREGKIDILLGTQMVAKGLNFPGVSLVGIILADSSLHLPDFRSYEKTFSLITQVAGRAGRYSPDGKVILQTLNPSHHIIRQAASMDMNGFYRRELENRRELGFPPFSRIIRILVRGKEPGRVWEHAKKIHSAVENNLNPMKLEHWEILGPSESPIPRLNNNYRVHMLILSSRLGPLQQLLPGILGSLKKDYSLYTEVDVDPQSML